MPWRRDRLPTPVIFGFPCGSVGKEHACNVGDLGLILGLGRSPGEGKTTHSSILAWRIPWTIESMGSQRVRHDRATFTSLLTLTTWVCILSIFFTRAFNILTIIILNFLIIAKSMSYLGLVLMNVCLTRLYVCMCAHVCMCVSMRENFFLPFGMIAY